MQSLYEEHMKYAQNVVLIRDYIISLATTKLDSLVNSKYGIQMECNDERIIFRRNIPLISNYIVADINVPYIEEDRDSNYSMILDDFLVYNSKTSRVLFYVVKLREYYDVPTSIYTEEQHFQDSLVLPEHVLKFLVLLSVLKSNPSPGNFRFKISYDEIEILSKILRYRSAGVIK